MALTVRFMMTCSIWPTSARTWPVSGARATWRVMSSPMSLRSMGTSEVMASRMEKMRGGEDLLACEGEEWRVSLAAAFGGFACVGEGGWVRWSGSSMAEVMPR